MRHMNSPLMGASCGGEGATPAGVDARGDEGRLADEPASVASMLRPMMDLRGKDGDDMRIGWLRAL